MGCRPPRLLCGQANPRLTKLGRPSQRRSAGNDVLRRGLRRRTCGGHRTCSQTEGADRACFPGQGISRIRQSLRRRNDRPRRFRVGLCGDEELRRPPDARHRFSLPRILSGTRQDSANRCSAGSAWQSLFRFILACWAPSRIRWMRSCRPSKRRRMTATSARPWRITNRRGRTSTPWRKAAQTAIPFILNMSRAWSANWPPTTPYSPAMSARPSSGRRGI